MFLASAGDLNINLVDVGGRSGMDVISRQPGVPVASELRLDFRFVVAERLQCLTNFLRRTAVQPAYIVFRNGQGRLVLF